MSRVALCVALFGVFCVVSSASAQIIYEPVEYQYQAGGTIYYYGGSNPYVHDLAAEPTVPGAAWGRINGLAFGSGDIRVHREVANEPERVFTDGFRRGMLNARVVGFTANDARNEAYARAPLYFTKRDLLRSAVRRDDAWHVPAQLPTVHVYKSSGMRIDSDPKPMPRPLMIIPKEQLIKPKAPDRQLAAAN